jgi:glyoxylase-like metal-dependent hydrolase (beta-lactamase superfamily II)
MVVCSAEKAGHTASHYCFALEEERTLFCGDHVMAWSTSIVSPPHGHMGDYIASLRRARDGGFVRLVPTHGADIADPVPFIEAYIAHRLRREHEIYECVRLGDHLIRDIVESAYADVDKSLHPAAMHSVWAHLIHLKEQGRVTADPAATINALYRISEWDDA